jgi:hypothetical protein
VIGKAHKFKPDQEALLRAICTDERFIVECQKIKRRYLRDLEQLPSRRPSDDAKHYRTLRRAFQPKPRHNITPPALRPFDVVSLALIDPDLRVWEEPAKSQRAAAAFRLLEQQPRSRTSAPQWPEIMAAKALKRLFEAHGLPFTDYASSDHNRRGKAALALAAIIDARLDIRHLIRRALGKAR